MTTRYQMKEMPDLQGTGEPITDKRKITEHELMIPAARILETTSQFIPTGQAQDVKDSPFDFSTSRSIGAHLYLSLIHILTNDPAKQEAIYTQATKQFPNDYRAYNNLGTVSYTHLG